MNIQALYHDNSPQAHELVERYCAIGENGKFRETSTQIATDFGIPQHLLATRVREVATLTRGDIQCSRCGDHYPVANRNDMTRRASAIIGRRGEWTCQQCIEEAEAEEKAALHTALQEVVKEKQDAGITIGDMGIWLRSALLSLLKHSGDESLSFVQPVNRNQIDSLAATREQGDSVIASLLGRNIIAISPNSPPGSVVFNEDGPGFRYSPRGAAWELAIHASEAESGGPAIYRMLNSALSDTDYLSQNTPAIQAMAEEVAEAEVLAYLEFCLDERGLPFRVGDKTQQVLNTAMENYSVGQVFAIIWRAARSASDYLVKTRCPKRQAANVVPGAMERFMERAAGNGWTVEPFRRPKSQPQSVLSRIVFNQLLGLPDGALSYNLPVDQIVRRQLQLRIDGE